MQEKILSPQNFGKFSNYVLPLKWGQKPYEKYLMKNVAKIYKRTPRSKIYRINIDAKNIVTKLG